jgi:hypothetical protein
LSETDRRFTEIEWQKGLAPHTEKVLLVALQTRRLDIGADGKDSLQT